MSKHYVARTVIEAIEIPDPPTSSSRGGYSADTPPPSRKKHTVANIVIADEDLESLVTRVGQHLALVQDGGPVE